MTFTVIEARSITSGDVGAYTAEPITWSRVNGHPQGVLPVVVPGMPNGSVRIIYNMSVPNAPSLVLVIKGSHHVRLDVNQEHLDIPGTHLQWTSPEGVDQPAIDARGAFPGIAEDGIVDDVRYERLLRAFAEHVGIGVSPDFWTPVEVS